ncbi:MAG: fumarate hydratase [Clostridiales bacterium]|nr:fumarate hydratase [Clostridiales bacterium]
MRTIEASQITRTISELFTQCSYVIGDDIKEAIDTALKIEPSPIGRNTLLQISQNYAIAASERVAICQDTGMSVVFAELGQDIHIQGGDYEDAIQQGVREAYMQGYLRKSIVAEPLFDRVNTKDNTPAVIHTRIVSGDKLKLTAVAKGFGSENMSALKMLVPADGIEGVKRFVLETVERAGPNPCPPIVVGLGIGGTFEQAALMAKEATALPLSRSNKNLQYKALEEELLSEINALGVGPGGTGGLTTALKVHIIYAPTHIAGLPVAINICCHAARHASHIL